MAMVQTVLLADANSFLALQISESLSQIDNLAAFG